LAFTAGAAGDPVATGAASEPFTEGAAGEPFATSATSEPHGVTTDPRREPEEAGAGQGKEQG
jgi:hypothetical protein